MNGTMDLPDAKSLIRNAFIGKKNRVDSVDEIIADAC